MTTELQNKAWSVLPKEFKEEVKNEYKGTLDNAPWEMPAKGYIRGRLRMMRELFGEHNLTSDADGDEMLTVPRKKVQEMYAHYDKICNDPNRPKDYIDSVYEYADGVTIALDDLFGSKCLPDKVDSSEAKVDSLEPKPAEPEKEVVKMKPLNSKVSVYLATKEEDEEFRLLLHKNGFTWNMGESLMNHTNWASGIEDYKMHYVYSDKTVTYCGEKTSDTLTFSEFKKQYFEEESRNLSQETVNCEKHFANILRDSFRSHNRLQIAAQIAQGALSNPNVTKSCADFETNQEYIAKTALMYADALIAESEKPTNNLNQN